MGVLRYIAGATVVGGVAVFGGVGAFEDETTRDSGGAIVESGGVGAFALRIGDCIHWPGDDDTVEVTSVEGVPCEQPHDGEVYGRFDLDAAGFSPARVESEGADGCLDLWEPAIGTVWEEDPDLDISTMVPTAESWDAGDREVLCIVVPVDGRPRTGSDRI